MNKLDILKKFFFPTLFTLLSINFSQFAKADCLPQYQNQVARKRFFNSKKEYQLMIEVLKESLKESKEADRPILSLLKKALEKKYPESNFGDEKNFAFLIQSMNDNKLFCIGEKPLKFEDIIKNFSQLSKDLKTIEIAKKRNNFLLILKDETITARKKIDLLKNEDDYDYTSDELFFFFRSKTLPTLSELNEFTSLRWFKINENDFKEHAFSFGLIKTPQNFINLFYKLHFNGSVLRLKDSLINQVLQLPKNPDFDQIKILTQMSNDPNKLFDHYFWENFIDTPQDFINIYLSNPRLKVTDESLLKLFQLKPVPTVKEILTIIDQFSLNPKKATFLREKTLVHSENMSAQEVIDLLQGNQGKLVDHSTLNNIVAKLYQNPEKPTFSQTEKIAKIVKNGNEIWNYYLWNRVKTPQDFIHVFSANRRIKISNQSFEKFFTMVPSPSIANVQDLIKLDHEMGSSDHVRNTIGKSDFIKEPQDLFDLYSGLGKFNFPDDVLNKFLSLRPKPTIKEIVRLANIHQDVHAVRAKAYTKNYVQRPQDLIDLYSGIGKINFTDATLDNFFNLKPQPTLDQIIQLANIHQDVLAVRTKAYTKNYVQRPQDLIDLFWGIEKVNFTDATIDNFLNLKPQPTMGQIVLLANIHRDQFAVRNKAYLKNFVQSPQDLIDLFSGIERVNFTDDTLNRFFDLLKPRPTLKQVIELANIYTNNTKIRNLAYVKKYAKTAQDFLDLFSGIGQVNFSDSGIEDFFKRKPSLKNIRDLIVISAPNKVALIRKLSQNIQFKIKNPMIVEKMKREIIEELKRKLADLSEENFCQNGLSEKLKNQKFFQLWGELNSALKEKHQQLKVLKKQNVPTFCNVCLEKRVGLFSICEQNEKCHYSECADCLKQDLQLKIKEKRFPLNCDSCHHELPISESDFKLLNSNGKVSEFSFPSIVKESVNAYHRLLFPHAKDCGTINCINRITDLTLDKNNHYNCEFCEGSFCIKCQEHHPKVSCEEHLDNKKGEKAFQKLAKDPKSGVRPCPYCYRPFNKDERCSTIKCPFNDCQKEWDWVEGRVIKTLHRFNVDTNSRVYRVPGEINSKTGKPYTDYTYIGKNPDNQRK